MTSVPVGAKKFKFSPFRESMTDKPFDKQTDRPTNQIDEHEGDTFNNSKLYIIIYYNRKDIDCKCIHE